MNHTTSCLSSESIELLLAGLSTPGDAEAAEEHIAECGTCRRRIARAIGSPEWWDDVRESLARDGARSPDGDVAVARPPSGTPADRLLELLGPSDDPRMLGRIGSYEVVGLIGHGGMGVVFKGFDAALNRFVAIKMLLPHLAHSGVARKRFAREAQAAAAVVDDHVMPIHCVAEWQGIPYFVMPYSRGVSLQKRLDREGPLELREILRIGLQTARGLAAAHAQGLVHRDVKPANILLDESVERVALVDFGLARAVDDASLTHSGTLAGTPQYMSPEQARGEAVDQRSDLFSLGSVLYAMCTGRAPFRTETSYGVLRRVTDEAPTPIREINPDIPEWLCGIIGRLMSKERDGRYASAREVAGLLEECLAHVQQPTAVPLPERVRDADVRRRGGRSGWRLSRVLAGAVLGLLLLLAGIVVVLETNKGTLRIESELDGVSVRITQGESLVEKLTITRDGTQVRLAAGQYIVELDGQTDGMTVENGTVKLTRGAREVVRIVNETRGPPVARAAEAIQPAADRGVESSPEPRTQPHATVASGRPRRAGHFTTDATGNSVTIACSPDGRLIAVANGSPPWIRHIPQRQQRDHRGQTGRTFGIELGIEPGWRPTAIVLEAATGRTIVSLPLTTPEEDAVLAGTPRVSPVEVTALAFAPDGETLAVGTSTGQVKLFNPRTGELLLSLDDERAKRADDETPENWKSLARALGGVTALAISPDGRLLAVCGNTFAESADWMTGVRRLGEAATSPGRLKVWDLDSGALLHDLVGHSHASAVAFSSDGSLLASAGQWAGDRDKGSGVILWNPRSGAKLRTITTEANVGTFAVTFSPTTKLLAIGSRHFDRENEPQITPMIQVVRPESGITEWQRGLPGDPRAFLPDGRTLAVQVRAATGGDATRGGTRSPAVPFPAPPEVSIQFVDAATGEVQHELRADDLPGGGKWKDFAVAAQGDILAIGGIDADRRVFVEVYRLSRPRADNASADEHRRPEAADERGVRDVLPQGWEVDADQIVWGEVRDGLQAGIGMAGGGEAFRTRDQIQLVARIRNVSGGELRIAWSSAGLRFVRPLIEDSDGERVPVRMPPAVRRVLPTREASLAPGEDMLFDLVRLYLAPDAPRPSRATPHVVASPGEYTIRYTVPLLTPRLSLETGELRFTVAQ